MFGVTAQCHGGGGDSGGDAALIGNTSEEEEPTYRDDAVAVMKELGIEHLVRQEFEKFRGSQKVLGPGTFATAPMHRVIRPSAGAGEFVATKTPKLNMDQDTVWQKLLYQAVASQDCPHIMRLRAWIDDGADDRLEGFGGAIIEYCRDSLASLTKSYDGMLPVLTQSTALRGTSKGLAHTCVGHRTFRLHALKHFDTLAR
jgi:hypothetical protein